MSEPPKNAAWLTLVGLGEDGPDGLPPASLRALENAEVVMGPPRHLALLSGVPGKTVQWPVPFADGLPILEGLRGQRVAVLVSGDPFWFGAGTTIAQRFEPSEWRALPAPSTFALAAARLGWPIEHTACLGLHATPIDRLRPHLASGQRAIVLLRNGSAVGDVARYLGDRGFGASRVTVMEALGGPRERITRATADAIPAVEFAHPVVVALEMRGNGPVLTAASGQDDDLFESDGQMTKRPMRALALSALAPQPHERLWDIGGGSGSIAIEWLLSHPSTEAISIEARPDRAARIRTNARRLGVDRLQVVEGTAPDALNHLAPPQVVFVGGGLSEALLSDLAERLDPGTRLVAHAVTLDGEALLHHWSRRLGGSLLRVALSSAAPLGGKRAWQSAYPVVQWQVVL